MWNLAGDGVGFREGSQVIATVLAGPKGAQRMAPLRSLRALPRLEPVRTYRFSYTTLTEFLGATSRAATSGTTASAADDPATGQRLGICRAPERGAIVVLIDGSRWEVQSFARFHTQLWLPSDDVRVELARSPVGTYRYGLKRVRDGRTVLARYLGR